jgi:hypothetical protein
LQLFFAQGFKIQFMESKEICLFLSKKVAQQAQRKAQVEKS